MRKLTLINIFIVLIYMFLVASSSNAITVSDGLAIGETNFLSDNSAEYLLNRGAGSDSTKFTADDTFTTDDGDTELQVGDILRGQFEITTIQNSVDTFNYGGPGNSELTAVFEAEVSSRTIVNNGGTPADTSDDLANYVFQPTGNLGMGVLVQFYEDKTNDDYTNFYSFAKGITGPDDAPGNSKEEQLIATATNGDPWWTMGFLGLSGEGWQALNAPVDVTAGDTLFSTANVNVAINVIDSNNGPQLARVVESEFGGFADLVGTANLFDPDLGTAHDVVDDFEFQIHPVPEPTTMLLFGTGLLGLVGLIRRKFKE